MPFANNQNDFRGMIAFVKALRFAQPVLKKLGINLKTQSLDETISVGTDLLQLATSFNAMFATRGWIACGAINTEAAKAAMIAGNNGRWEEADTILADSYSAPLIGIYLRRLSGLKCFARRVPLARLALEDYEAGRYHACVPVTLSLLDGMGKDLTGAGFFRRSMQLNSKDSFLEIGPGVALLLRTMSVARNRTTDADISIPHRHGILHGTDLGYANKVVAAKAWAAILAVGHYATDATQPPSPPDPGFIETLRNYARTHARLKELEADAARWSPRSEHVIAEIVASQTIMPGSPEHAVLALLEAWQTKRFGVVASSIVNNDAIDVNALAGKIRTNIGAAPHQIRVIAIEDSAPAAGWVSVALTRGDEHTEVRLRMLFVREGEWVPSTSKGGRWLVHSLWPLESARWHGTQEEGESAP